MSSVRTTVPFSLAVCVALGGCATVAPQQAETTGAQKPTSFWGALTAPPPAPAPAQPALAPQQPVGAAVPTTAATSAGLALPQPILGNTGQYMSPFTEDGTVTLWVEKAVNAKMGSAVGGMVGAEAGKKIFEQVPFFGGMFGKSVGEAAGREIAIKTAGGWDFIKANSDLSFNSLRDMAGWMKATHGASPHYAAVVSSVKEIYPELKAPQYSAML
jgi:hypothetical protein